MFRRAQQWTAEEEAALGADPVLGESTAGMPLGWAGMGNAEREGMTARFGFEEWLMQRRGSDPHASERRWFAEQTESMREEMTQRYIEGRARSAARGPSSPRARHPDR